MNECTVIMQTLINDKNVCNIEKCFNCNKSDYMLLDDNLKIIKDFKDKIRDFSYYSQYIVQFKEEVNAKEIFSYLENKESDYKVTRIYSTENGYESIVLRDFKNQKVLKRGA